MLPRVDAHDPSRGAERQQQDGGGLGRHREERAGGVSGQRLLRQSPLQRAHLWCVSHMQSHPIRAKLTDALQWAYAVTGESSWPISTFGSFIYRQSTMQDCSKAQALSSFFVWALNNTAAEQIAQRQGFVLTSSS